MDIENYTKNVYNKHGKQYQETREQKHKDRVFNEFLELPCMLDAVGNIKGKRLLDVGCGAAVHIKKYLSKGAVCYGMDISEAMIEMAKKNCPDVEFKVGSMKTLPYKNSFFDIVTASLSIDYIKNQIPVFKEIARVLKKGGLFYYSNESEFQMAKEKYEDDEFKIEGVGSFLDKKQAKEIFLGNAWKEGLIEWDMLPEMKIKSYRYTYRTQLRNLCKAGFELVDFINCRPTKEFKKIAPHSYEKYSRFPIFSIFVGKKK